MFGASLILDCIFFDETGPASSLTRNGGARLITSSKGTNSTGPNERHMFLLEVGLTLHRSTLRPELSDFSLDLPRTLSFTWAQLSFNGEFLSCTVQYAVEIPNCLAEISHLDLGTVVTGVSHDSSSSERFPAWDLWSLGVMVGGLARWESCWHIVAAAVGATWSLAL